MTTHYFSHLDHTIRRRTITKHLTTKNAMKIKYIKNVQKNSGHLVKCDVTFTDVGHSVMGHFGCETFRAVGRFEFGSFRDGSFHDGFVMGCFVMGHFVMDCFVMGCSICAS